MSQSGYNTIFDEDAKDLESVIESHFDTADGTVDAIITSPPYADLQNYGDEDEQIGEQAYEQFLADLKDIFEQCYKVAAEDATLWVITDTFKRHGRIVRLPFDIADEIENLPNKTTCPECGGSVTRQRDSGVLRCDDEECAGDYDPLEESWRMEDHIIWDKKRTRPWRRKGSLRNVYEHISMFSKSDNFEYNIDDIRVTDTDEFSRWWVDYPERYNPKGMVPGNIWEFEIPKQGEWGPKLNYHPSPFPLELISRIIKLATDEGDVVLDPFAGVGTTVAVAEKHGRKGIGFEINPEFIEHYEEYVRPNITSEQSTLFEDEQPAETARKIWTLRIHKYALEIYKGLLEIDDLDISHQDIGAIVSLADPVTLTRDSQEAHADLFYVTTDDLHLSTSQVDEAKAARKSEKSSSGNYYELATTISIGTSKYIEPNEERSSYHVYVNGIHNYYEEVYTNKRLQELLDEIIKKYSQTANPPPLVSNLGILVENPYTEGQYEDDSLCGNIRQTTFQEIGGFFEDVQDS